MASGISAVLKAPTKRIVMTPQPGLEPKPRMAATANQARAAQAEAPLMPRGLWQDVGGLLTAAVAGLGIPFAAVVLRSFYF